MRGGICSTSLCEADVGQASRPSWTFWVIYLGLAL